MPSFDPDPFAYLRRQALARGMAWSGGTPTPTPTPGPAQLANGARGVGFGNSITQGYNSGQTLGAATAGKSNPGDSRSDIGWALAYDRRFRFDNWPDVLATMGTGGFIRYTEGANQGVSGENTAQILTRVQAWIAANRTYDFWIYNGGGVNDINGTYNIPLATTKANIQAAVDALVATGKPGILAPPRPELAAGYLVDGAAIWTWMQATFGAGTAYEASLYLADYQTPFLTDGPVADDFRDQTLHPGTWGAQGIALGRDLSVPASSLLGRIRQLVAPGNLALTDLWTRTNIGYANPTLTGTSGGAAAGVTTSSGVATGLSIIRSSGTGATAVATVEANADTGGQSQVLTITPSGATNDVLRINVTAVTGATANNFQNKWVQFVAEVESDSATFFGNAYAKLICSDSAYVADALQNTGSGSSQPTSGKMRGALRYWLVTEPILMPATVTSVTAQIFLNIHNSLGASPGVFKLRRIRTVEISDPRPGYGY